MRKRLLIVGGVAGGASCASRARRLSEDSEIILFERGEHVSFANCGMPYHIGGEIKDRSRLLRSPKVLPRLFRIDVRTKSEVIRIHPEERTVEVRETETGRVYSESYDALLLASGAAPIRPPLPGIDLDGIYSLRNISDMDAIVTALEQIHAASPVAVVGGGFIGLEMAEQLIRKGLEVDLIEMLPQVMPGLDPEMASPLSDELARNGVRLYLGEQVTGFDRRDGRLVVRTGSGKDLPAKAVILAIGVRPETDLARDAGLDIGELGGIRTDSHMRTSDQAIWAVGDVVEVRDRVTGEWSLVPLAGPANRQGRIAADNIFGLETEYPGALGTAIVRLFETTAASVGAGEKKLRGAGMSYEKTYTHSFDHVTYFPGSESMAVKLLFEPRSGKVLGVQIVGGRGVDKRVDVVAACMHAGMTVFDLEELELAYAPPYGAARDPVNMAGMVAANVVRDHVGVVHWGSDSEPKPGGTSVVLDVRSNLEWEAWHIPGALHVHVNNLREQIDSIPREAVIHPYCTQGQRSYYASRILRQKGFRVENMSGGILTREMVEKAAEQSRSKRDVSSP